MQIVREMSDLGPLLTSWRKSGLRIALVPTMGALHDGHLALVRAAQQEADRVIATIFVNPLQFNDKGDLDRYPRTEDADIAKLEAAGCDVVWLPRPAQLYPEGFATTVSVRGVSDRWEGAHRPGHFEGVATVVAKLFIACGPDIAIFGEKDWQQLAVIRRMAADLGIPVTIIGHPTVRENDGLAMSSRNALLSAEDRETAIALPRALEDACQRIAAGEVVGEVLKDSLEALAAAGFGAADYLAYVDGATLEALEHYRDGGRLIAAAFLGKVRLIDNIRVVSVTDRKTRSPTR
jgi:pantoate--beta-alanine ligase